MSDDGLQIDKPAKQASAASAGMGVMALLTFLLFAGVLFLQWDETRYMKGQGIVKPATDDMATRPVLSP